MKDGSNWYVYGANNPNMFIDPSGNSIIGAIVVGFVLGGLLNAGIDTTIQLVNNNFALSKLDGRSILSSFIAGGVTGAVAALPGALNITLSLSSMMGFGAGLGMINYTTYSTVMMQTVTFEGMLTAGLSGALAGAASYGLGYVGNRVSQRIAQHRLKAPGTPGNTNGNRSYQQNRQYWKEHVDFEGTRVYQRNDLFDPDYASSWIHSTELQQRQGFQPLCG